MKEGKGRYDDSTVFLHSPTSVLPSTVFQVPRDGWRERTDGSMVVGVDSVGGSGGHGPQEEVGVEVPVDPLETVRTRSLGGRTRNPETVLLLLSDPLFPWGEDQTPGCRC